MKWKWENVKIMMTMKLWRCWLWKYEALCLDYERMLLDMYVYVYVNMNIWWECYGVMDMMVVVFYVRMIIVVDGILKNRVGSTICDGDGAGWVWKHYDPGYSQQQEYKTEENRPAEEKNTMADLGQDQKWSTRRSEKSSLFPAFFLSVYTEEKVGFSWLGILSLGLLPAWRVVGRMVEVKYGSIYKCK